MLSAEKVVNLSKTQSTEDHCLSPVHQHHRRLTVKNRYEFLRTLGKGTYAKVKLARHKEVNKLVAVKVISKDMIKDNVDLKHIRREIEIMSTIQHQHIIQIYEVFENDDKIVIVMEYAAGGELYNYLASRRGLNEGEARSFFRQIVSAIRYCHKMGIVHRDLKLENILLDDRNQIKIADFGLANMFKTDSLLHTFCGSPLYASPEIVRGVPYVGPEVDSWSLGVLLYTLVYGTMPFDGRNFQVLTKLITNGEINKPAKETDAHDLIVRMLTVDPSKRATADEIATHKWLGVTDDFTSSCVTNAASQQNVLGRDDVTLLANDCGCLDTTLIASHLEESEARHTKNALKYKPGTPSGTPKAAFDVVLAGQLAAVCGLNTSRDRSKSKNNRKATAGQRKVSRSKCQRESGYYSSPERATKIACVSNSDCKPYASNSLQVLNTSDAATLHQSRSLQSGGCTPNGSAPLNGGTRDCYLVPISGGSDEFLNSNNSDDGTNSISVKARSVSTYSDSSILSSDSFELFDSTLLLSGAASYQVPPATGIPAVSQRPLSLSLVPDTLPPMPESLYEDQPPGTLTPNSERLVRGLQRILDPNGRRSQMRRNRTYSNDVIKRPQSLNDASQFSAVINQLDLELAYHQPFDSICASLKSAEV